MTAEQEAAWWGSLEGDDIDINLHGVPAYDVERVAERVHGWLPRNSFSYAYVLDLGCGRGRLTNRMAERLGMHGDVDGVDIAEPMLELAADGAPPNASYWLTDGRSLPYGLGTRMYDLAYSVTMFQHIPHDAMWSYIHQVHDRLVPGGVFTFTLAVGDEPHQFLNHQVWNISEFYDRMRTMFDKVEILVPIGDEAQFEFSGDHGWTWVTAWKAAA